MLSTTLVCLWLAGASPKDVVKDALAELRAGHCPQALKLLDAVEETHRDFVKVQYLRGETLLLLGDAEAASEAFARVVRDRPGSVPALVGLATANLELGRLEEASEHLENALEEEPGDLAALRTKSRLARRLGDPDAARAAAEKAFAADPKEPANVQALVEHEVEAGDAERALELARRLSAQAPRHPLGPFLEGLALERLEKVDEAISAYQRSLDKDPTFLDAHKNLAILGHTRSDTYEIAARNKLAMDHYARYFELGGRDPELEKTYRQLEALVKSGAIRVD